MALSSPAERLPPSPQDDEEDENDLPFPPAPASPPPSPPRPHASSTTATATAAKPILSAPHMALLIVPLLLGLLLFQSMQRLPPNSSPLDALEPFLLLLLLLPLVLFLLTTLSSFSSSLKAAPRLSKAEKKSIKYAHAKQRLRYTRQKYHRKKSQVYKELTEEEQAEVKARMAARKEERDKRFAALLAVDAGWLIEREERGKAKREAREMNKKEEEEEEDVDNEDESDDNSSSALPPTLPSHLRLALDLHYGESIHGLRGTRSLTQQVGWCYHSLKRASSFHNTPIFHLTSFQGPTAEMLKGSGIHNWPIYRHEEELPVVFPRGSIVYLSPDAEEVLTAPLDLTKVYVIGGIVDRTVVRGISQQAASRWNVQTARLPLEYLNLKAKQATAALNVDTMVKVMMAVHANGGDWLAALEECLPKRKAVEKSKGEIKRERREREERGEQEEGEEEED